MSKNKSENRKAFPKFIAMILIGALFGAVVGFMVGLGERTTSLVDFYQKLNDGLTFIAPYAMWLSLFVFSGYAILNYRKAQEIYSKWDGDDDEFIKVADNKLNYSLMFSQFNLIIAFFLMITNVISNSYSMVTVLGFIVTLGVIVYSQQKIVDLIKQFNPEKQGSIYDSKFQKKWLESCDENEIRQIGQASYKAYVATTTTCIILLLATLFISDILDSGFYPTLLVVIIWTVSSIAYFTECIRINK